MMVNILAWARLVGLLLFIGAPAFAHQQKLATTSVVIKENSLGLEVVHRFFLHDIEPVVRKLAGDSKLDFLSDQEAQAIFGHYVETQFLIGQAENLLFQLRYIGHEVDGQYFWVYQELSEKLNVDEIRIKHGALTEYIDGQKNLVNLEHNGHVKSAYFSQGEEWYSFSPW